MSDANSGTGMRGTLRFCINKVNDLPGPDTIVFHVTGTIKLTSDLTRLASDITMIGPGADMLAVNGNGSSAWTGPIFYIETGSTVAISGLTITNGYSDCCVPGGIYNTGTLTLKDSAVTKNYNFFDDPYDSAAASPTTAR